MPKAFQGDLLPRLDWRPLDDGAVAAALLVSSQQATSVRVGVRARLPEGAEIRFFHPGGVGEPHAVVTAADFHFPNGSADAHAGNGEDDGQEGRRKAASEKARAAEKAPAAPEPEMLWSPSVDGDVIGIEITLPSRAAVRASSFRVEKVAHRFLDARSVRHKALDCPDLHVDVQCRVEEFPAGLENAVALIDYEDEGSSALCSGTLLNDGDPETFIPYFLTANHCVATAKVARTVQATWFYQRESCGGESVDVRAASTAGGAELLATSPRQDSTLLKIRQRLPANVYFAGWDATDVGDGEAVVAIHHPAGEVKKYSAGAVLGKNDSQGVEGALVLTWDEGVTEGGSSGSAIFRDGFVIGALSHGDDCGSADYRDFYGPFADFFPRVCSTLDPNGGCGDGEHDLPFTAASISPGDTVAGAVDEVGDVDYWRVAIPSQGTLTAETTGNADTVGALENERGITLATNDDGGAGLNFRIERDVDAGTYFIRVAAAETSFGDYVLHVEHAASSIDALPALSANADTAAVIATRGEVDRWRLEVETNGFVVLSTGGNLDTVGRLEDASGELLASDDDGGPRTNFRIESFLSAGTYVLDVRGYGDQTGLYTLQASHTPLADVQAVAASGSAGEIVNPTEGDYWRFDVTSLGVSTLATTGSTDTIGALHIASGQRVATNNDSGEGRNFHIERVLVPGAYYARVGAFGERTGAYTVLASHAPLADADVFEVGANGRGTGAVDEAGDVDTWRFEAASAASAVVETTGSTDTFGSLEDGMGRASTNDDGGANENFRIASHLEPGTYFVRVSGFGDTTGDYALHVDLHQGADVGDTRGAAAALGIDEAQNSAIGPAGDVDYWRINVPSPGTLVVESEGDTDTLGTLEDALGGTLAQDDDGGSRRNFRIERQVAPGVYFIRVRGYGTANGAYTLRASHTRDALSIPWFLAAQAASARQGFARLINRSARSGTVRVQAIDDAGTAVGSFTLSLQAGQTVHFNSNDLEDGNSAKGIAVGVGDGTGDWRLRLDTDLDLNVLSYVRTGQGFLTNMHDVVGRQVGSAESANIYMVPIFNPASNRRQVSKLRLFNLEDETAAVIISALDDDGQSAPGGRVRFSLAAGAARTLTAQELEAGDDDLQGSLGDGAGKWELAVGSSQPLGVMNLMETPSAEDTGAATGNLTNLSTRHLAPSIAPGARSCAPAPCEVPYFVAADDPLRQGFVRIGNYSTRSGTVEIHAVDDNGQRYGPVTIALAAGATVHFNSDDLEDGNAAKGMSGSVGDGVGDWRLEVRTDLEIVGPLAYARANDGFLTSMHDIVRGTGENGRRHVVPIFNPASNRNQRSRLRIVNPTPRAAAITIAGVDDLGQPGPLGEVALTVPAGRARIIKAQHLEAGHSDMTGRLGDGAGKWRLVVTSDQPVRVLNTLVSPTGNLTNLSSSPQG